MAAEPLATKFVEVHRADGHERVDARDEAGECFFGRAAGREAGLGALAPRAGGGVAADIDHVGPPIASLVNMSSHRTLRWERRTAAVKRDSETRRALRAKC